MSKQKEELFKACLDIVSDKIFQIQKRIQELQADLNQETKSTAGDKHETGRAMIHLEIEKVSQQLTVLNQKLSTLRKIKPSTVPKNIVMGTIVETNIGKYFLSVSLGMITINQDRFYTVSPVSPIGEQLLGKNKGDSLIFKGRKIKINNIL